MTTARPRITFDVPPDADRGKCRSCGEPIAWILTAAGKRMPVEIATRESHFAHCPQANQHRRSK